MTGKQDPLFSQTPEGRLADWLVACGWDRRSAQTYAPRGVKTCRSLPRCPCGGPDGTGCNLSTRDRRHGNRQAGYKSQGCRCLSCRRANAAYVAERRAKTA